MSAHSVNGVPWLTLVLFIPAVMALVLQPFPRRAALAIKGLTIATTLVVAGLVAAVLAGFDGSSGGAGTLPMQFQERHDWLPAIGTSYHLGIDGLSGWLLALNAGLFLIAALWVSHRSTERMKLFCGLLLLSETATAGVLLSQDLLLFYLFWEAMLIPLYFWLSSYGGPKRGPATLKFVIYTVAGSLFMLLSIIFLYVQTGRNGGHASFDLSDALRVAGRSSAAVQVSVPGGGSHISLLLSPSQFAFLGFAIAFLIKTPIVPFHTWLPDLYEAAPSAALVPFAGIVGKLGLFGFLRYCVTLFPDAAHSFQFVLAGLAVLSIIYGALMALVQNDIKRLVAYASLSHLGFILLGIFSLNGNGINGAI
ncbi:MAG: NuoM family protein, partial [Candidatus Dormibacteria bacterium]